MLLAHLHATHEGNLPQAASLRLAAVACLGFALLAAAPWTNWGIDWKLFNLDPDKTTLAPLRLIDALAFFYVLMSASWFDRLVRRPWLRFVEVCGRHSLEGVLHRYVFLAHRPADAPQLRHQLEMQLLVNGVGFASMIGLALLLDRPRRAAAPGPCRCRVGDSATTTIEIGQHLCHTIMCV